MSIRSPGRDRDLLNEFTTNEFLNIFNIDGALYHHKLVDYKARQTLHILYS